MEKTLKQDFWNRSIEFKKEHYNYHLRSAIRDLGLCIADCNFLYYNAKGLESPISDTEYDELCKKYVALNKVAGINIELRSCSFLKAEDFLGYETKIFEIEV